MRKIKEDIKKITHHTVDKVIEEYEELEGSRLYKYLYSLPEFDRIVIMLYGELKSYRKVAKCTNRTYFIVGEIVRQFKKNYKLG